ncbi:MAG: single-stranded-DNA-specific exonuclease RecJ [candidate division Zixibacteria bacterium]|nr:single-stranded-DNA-specific exonuclease RecJ [candidate division Zixibacteria bacterium]
MIQSLRTKNPIWDVVPVPDSSAVRNLSEALELPPAIVKILLNRGFESPEAVEKFLNPRLSDLHDPFLLHGMDKAMERVTKALLANEKIVIYGDYDVDGITATSLLYIIFNKLGAQVDYFLPNRLVEGYGLSVDGINEVKKQGADLIITVDTGINAIDEVAYANSQGIDVIITDHHEPREILPEAVAIINPKQEHCQFNEELSGVGVAFKFAQAVHKALGQSETELYEHLDLVALGTAADIVPLVGENRVLTRFGIPQISRTTKPGLKSLTFVSGLMGKEISTGQVVFVLAPRINAIGRLGDAKEAIRLLSTRDEKVAQEVARKLDDDNRKRKRIDEETLNEALAQLKEIADLENDKAIVLAGEGWHLGVIGIVASRIVERYHLPTVMISLKDGLGKGSARSIPGFHLCDALNKCEDFLIQYGGHKYAAGLSIEAKNVEKFRKKFIEVSNSELSDDDIQPKLKIDMEIELSEVNDHFMELLEKFAPFGPQNMRPVFLTRNCEIVGRPSVVGNNHLRLRVRKGTTVIDVIGFGFGDMLNQISTGSLVDAVYTLEYNTYNNVTRVQMRIKDIKLTVSTMAPGYK